MILITSSWNKSHFPKELAAQACLTFTEFCFIALFNGAAAIGNASPLSVAGRLLKQPSSKFAALMHSNYFGAQSLRYHFEHDIKTLFSDVTRGNKIFKMLVST